GVSSFLEKRSKLLQAPRLPANSTTVRARATRVQALGPDGTIMSLNTSTRRCFPEGGFANATKTAQLSAPVYPKIANFVMRLSRHSARIKAKVKAKSRGFQDTSGP